MVGGDFEISYKKAVPSSEAVASCKTCGWYVIEFISPVWSFKQCRVSCVELIKSYRKISLSAEPVAQSGRVRWKVIV